MKYPLVALALSLAATSANANTASITLNGRVLPGTCSITNASQTIRLDDIKADEVATGDNALKPVSLSFASCIGVGQIRLTFAGTADPGDTQRWKNTAAASGAATGIALSLLEGASGSQYLYPGLAMRTLNVSGSTATYSMRAGYYRRATGAAELKPGNVTTQITVNVTYQ